MIDGLVTHLKESKANLTTSEIKAAEDFAIFQTNMEREDEHLRHKIDALTKSIADLANQINVGNAQLVKRVKLLHEAEEELRIIRKICKEKKEYYQKESKRRTGEIVIVESAKTLFANTLEKLSKRVRDRAANLSAGGASGSDLSKVVVTADTGMNKDFSANVAGRADVAW